MSDFRLVYRSQINENIPQSIDEIGRVSGKYNAAHHITGCLFRAGTCYYQIIEGPQAEVENLYAHICADPRHIDILLLQQRSITRHTFPDFGMLVLTESEVGQLLSMRALGDGRDAGLYDGINYNETITNILYILSIEHMNAAKKYN